MSAAEKWKTVSSVQSFFSSLLLGIVSNLLCIIKSNLCILLPAIHMIKKKEERPSTRYILHWWIYCAWSKRQLLKQQLYIWHSKLIDAASVIFCCTNESKNEHHSEHYAGIIDPVGSYLSILGFKDKRNYSAAHFGSSEHSGPHKPYIYTQNCI